MKIRRLLGVVRSTLVVLIAFLVTTSDSAASAASTSISGTVIVTVVDYPDESSEYLYSLRTEEGDEFALDLQAMASKLSYPLKSGMKVTVSGDLAGFEISVDSLVVDEPAPRYASSGEIGGLVVNGQRKAVMILVNLLNATVPCSSSTLDSIFYTATQSVRGVYEESSRNQLSFTRDVNGDTSADIFGPYTINYNAGNCDYNNWRIAARAAAQADGVNFSLYQHEMYILPQWNSIGCSWTGLGQLGCGDSCTLWIADCDSINTFAHELGHNFGMEHASSVSVGGTVTEYGDGSCPMGAYDNLVLFNAPHEIQMGWFDTYPGQIQTITTEGTYYLAPLESNPATATDPQVIRIQASSGNYYYLSYRRNSGTYNELSSTYVNKTSVHRYNPSGSDKHTFLMKALGNGSTYEDSTLGISFSQVSSTDERAAILVSLGASAGDTDGDGVSDFQETIDGSDINDPGSYINHLSSPIYLLWNGFLQMFEYAELINPGSGVTQLTVSLYGIDGTLQSTTPVTLSAGQQYDLPIHGLPGFTADSYGVVKVEYTGELDGRLSYYRQSGSNYEFAYSIPFVQPLYGTTSAGFNTYQPSTNAAEASFPVFNWITIVNLASDTKTFTINSYSQAGALLATRTETIAGFGRSDIDGGHGFAGPGVVGMHTIAPTDGASPYVAQVIRYGAADSMGLNYAFAFPLSFHAGTGRMLSLPISRQFTNGNTSETTWVEVTNTTASPVSVNVVFRNAAGTSSTVTQTLGAYAQQHFEANSSILGAGTVGYVTVTPSVANSVIAQSMFYIRDASTGSIRAMYGISGREVLGDVLNGSYNLFLDQDNYLTITNSTASSVVADITTTRTDGTSSTVSQTFGAYSTVSLAYHNAAYGTSPDSYGFIQITPSTTQSLLVDLIRIRPVTGGYDYAFPTEVRPR